MPALTVPASFFSRTGYAGVAVLVLLLGVAGEAAPGQETTKPAAAQAAAPALQPVGISSKRIFPVAPVQWDADMRTARPGLPQTMSDFADLTGGIMFGMNPAAVDAVLPTRSSGVIWTNLPVAAEFSDDVRYFSVRMDAVGELRAKIEGCIGQSSYVTFLFGPRGLFRASFRFIADKACPSVSAAAADVFARYLMLSPAIALSVHYRTGPAEIVDISDPTAGFLVPQRWHYTER